MVYLVQLLFYGIPVAALVFFIVSLCRFVSAKRSLKENPESIAPEDMQRRKLLLQVSSVIAGVFVAVIGGIAALLFTAVAFM